MVSIKWQWCAAWAIAVIYCVAAREVRAQCETQRLFPADGAAGDQFGTSVDIDGNRIIVGAPVHNATIGAAYVFVHSPSGWMHEAKLTDVQVLPGDDFARTVSISGDYAAVGAPKSDRASKSDIGRVFIYARSGPHWLSENLSIPAPLWLVSGSEFGTSVSVSGDAVLVGAPFTDDVSVPPNFLGNSGSAYIFRRDGATGNWLQEAKLTAHDADEFDQFGFTVALHGDTAFVTAFGDKDPNLSPNNTIGSVYVFRKQGPVWMQVQKLGPSDAAAQALQGSRNFGRSLSTDGTVLLVGERSGQSAYVFRFDGSTWVEEAILRKPVGNTAPDQFANSVAIQGDTALVGAPLDDDNALSNSGSIFVYKRSSGIWGFDSIFHGSSPAPNGRLGSSLAVGGVYAVAGAISPTTSGEATVLAVQPVPDCDGNLEQDECQLHANPAYDGNGNGHIDACECAMDSECEDNVPCTANVCDPASGICVFTPLPGFCLIAGMCQTDGDIHPDTECRLCDVSLSVTTWSAKLDGTACSDDGNACTRNICVSGFCSHPGEPAGLPCGDASGSACDKPDSCSGDGLCLKNFASSSTNCDDGLFCNGGSERCNGQGTCVPLTPIPCSIDPSLPLCDEVNDVCVQCIMNADCTGGGECPGTMCDVNGLCQLDPAQIGTACGDPATTQCSLPDTCAAAHTCAPNHLPNGTPCSPDMDPCTFDVCVNGTCAHVYEFTGDPTGAVDCNNNSIADTCDLALGLSADCDGNAKPDECDLPLFTAQSPQLSPIGAGFAQTFTLSAPPKATGNVTLRFAARGDFLAATEKVAISVNGMAAGEIFTFNGLDCPVTPDEEELVMTAAQFNLAAGSGDALITMTATAAVDAALCVPASWITVAVEYRGVQTGDCNGNGQFDTCEVQAGTQPDCNYNHVPDICEPDCDADGVPDACALHYYPANDKDCNSNGIPDRCDVLNGESEDCNENLVPDECEYDCQFNGVSDECDIASGVAQDCNDDQVPDECPLVTEQIPQIAAGDLAVDGNRAISGSAGYFTYPGNAYVIERGDNGWELTTTISGDFIGPGAQFGASVDVQGDQVVIGAPSHEVNSVYRAGSVHVYKNVGASTWIAEAHLADETVGMNARLGSSVAIAGEWMLTGAPGASVALMFRRENGVWTQHSRWVPPVVSVGFGRFGHSVSLDGNWAAVGEMEMTMAGTVVGGALHLYHFDGQGWNYAQLITSPEPRPYDQFGYAVVIENDRLVVSAQIYEPPAGSGTGTAFVFRNEGGFWTQEAELVAQNRGFNDYFGTTLAFNDPYVVVAAPRDRLIHHHSGVAYVFRRTQSTWTQVSKLGFPRIGQWCCSRFANAVGIAGTKVLITEVMSAGAFEFEFMPPSCQCPPIPVTFIDPPNGVIDARQHAELDDSATPQGIDRFVVTTDEHTGTDCWLLSPSLLGIPGYPTESVDYNGDGTYTVITGGPTLPGLNQFNYTDSLGNATIATVTSHPGNVDGGPFADADDALAHAQCCLGGSMCGPEYDQYRCDMNHSEATTAEDLIRVLDLLNGAGVYSPQLGTPLPAGP